MRFVVIFGLLFVMPSLAVPHDPAPPPRVVSVSGVGEVQVKPDRARLRLGVEKIGPDLKKVEAEVNRIVRAVLSDVKALGAKDEQISTTGISLQPEYVWPEGSRKQTLTGYRVSRQIEVQVEDLDRLGDFILRTTDAGVNQVDPIRLESSRAETLKKQAMIIAAEDARDKASLLAKTLGARLGTAQRLTEVGSQIPPVMPMAESMRMESADSNAEMGLAFGEIRYSFSVQADFDLLPQ